ncbi:MAG: class IV adenylate cyclase [bacterium]|nr:class IV adenylate cyclase [bacterium]
MREIEIKARVADKTSLLATLKAQAIILTEPVTQRDQVFGLPGAGGGSLGPWLRIRTETNNGQKRQIFTLKKSVTNQMDSIEHETEVANEVELAKIIEHIGYTPYSDSTKTRQKARRRDIEICIDAVESLGDFIEAEKLTTEDADYEKVAEELWALLINFGIRRDDQVNDGYDVLIRKNQGFED